MADTKIEWATKVWNPTRGCSRVSAGCDHCYAMREARRHDHPGGAYEGLTRIGSRGVDWKGVVRLVPEMLDAPHRWRKPQRVFVNSMSDLFHESLSDLGINRVFGEMARAPQHTFLILTKRPRRALAFFEWARVANATVERWPLRNVWLGVSVEDQATADERIPLLLQMPAAVRWVSYEPALGAVDFRRWLLSEHGRRAIGAPAGIGWIVIGGESGHGARPLDILIAHTVIEQCRAAGVPVFLKQFGSRPTFSHDDLPSGLSVTFGWAPHVTFPRGREVHLRDRKGGDMAEWPEWARVREFPAVRA